MLNSGKHEQQEATTGTLFPMRSKHTSRCAHADFMWLKRQVLACISRAMVHKPRCKRCQTSSNQCWTIWKKSMATAKGPFSNVERFESVVCQVVECSWLHSCSIVHLNSTAQHCACRQWILMLVRILAHVHTLISHQWLPYSALRYARLTIPGTARVKQAINVRGVGDTKKLMHAHPVCKSR